MISIRCSQFRFASYFDIANMVSSTVLYVFCALAVKLSSSASTSHWTTRIKLEKQVTSNNDPIDTDDELNILEEPDGPKPQTSEDVTFWMLNKNVTETSSDLFDEGENNEKNSTIFEDVMENSEVDSNGTVNVEPIAADKEDVEDKYTEHDDFTNNTSKMDENILLARNNCNLEIEVSEVTDVKVRIKIEPLKQNSSGKCCITLNGYEGTMLAVLVSDIHLHHLNDSIQGETLKVVVTTAGVDFVIKQYCGEDKNLPLLLTETNRVYLIIHYNVTTITPGEGYTEFNLEAFTYHKHENSVMNKGDYENYYPMPNRNIQNIYFTTQETPDSFRHLG